MSQRLRTGLSLLGACILALIGLLQLEPHPGRRRHPLLLPSTPGQPARTEAFTSFLAAGLHPSKSTAEQAPGGLAQAGGEAAFEAEPLGPPFAKARQQDELPYCPSHLNGTGAPDGRRRAIFYLVAAERLDQLAASLAALFLHFNDRYRYPVILFEDAVQDTGAATRVLAQALRPDQLCLLKWYRVAFAFPPGFNETQARLEGVEAPHVFPRYQHMIAFWLRGAFELPLTRGLEFYWRLDTDSLLRAPVRYDLFEAMARNRWRLGYRAVSREPPNVVRGLYDLTDAFCRARGLPLFPREAQAWAIYNNFEVLHVPSLLASRPLRAYVEAVHASHGVYTRRWGDAPIRMVQLHLFLGGHPASHCFCNIDYHHKEAFPPNC